MTNSADDAEPSYDQSKQPSSRPGCEKVSLENLAAACGGASAKTADCRMVSRLAQRRGRPRFLPRAVETPTNNPKLTAFPMMASRPQPRVADLLCIMA